MKDHHATSELVQRLDGEDALSTPSRVRPSEPSDNRHPTAGGDISVRIERAQGMQFGDGNTQHNTFGA